MFLLHRNHIYFSCYVSTKDAPSFYSLTDLFHSQDSVIIPCSTFYYNAYKAEKVIKTDQRFNEGDILQYVEITKDEEVFIVISCKSVFYKCQLNPKSTYFYHDQFRYPNMIILDCLQQNPDITIEDLIQTIYSKTVYHVRSNQDYIGTIKDIAMKDISKLVNIKIKPSVVLRYTPNQLPCITSM